MQVWEGRRFRPVEMGNMPVDVERRPDGTIYLSSRARLPAVPPSIIAVLDDWADRTPDATFIADRGPDGNWRKVSYAEARDKSRAIATWLLGHPLGADRPVMILSRNSVTHALLALGAMRAGVAYAPVAPAYSTVSGDFDKLKHVVELVTPGLIFAEDLAQFAPAIAATRAPGVPVVGERNIEAVPGAISFAELLDAAPHGRLEDAEAALNPDTIAKFLFTSGSTGHPKAVVNTQRMVTTNQVMIREALAFLKSEPPVMVDWLPWNHTAGGNHNFGIALYNGGSLYIDDGNPTPNGIARTVRNLAEVAPTLYFNVPKGYEMLVDHLATDDSLREKFFSRLRLLQYAGASLSAPVWAALEDLSVRTTGARTMIITGYGSTETAPFASTTTWTVNRPGEIGLPAAGLTMKLVPRDEKLELRLKGPSITPGYWRQPEKTAESFDEEGYYKIGDALTFVDPDRPEAGLLFNGRVSEDFKLDTGTWVNYAGVRSGLLTALAPFCRDLVLTGLDRGHIGALLFVDPTACRRAFPDIGDGDEAACAVHPGLRAEIEERLSAHAAQATGSSMLVARAVILGRAPNPVRGEITDKGSLNIRAVIAGCPAEHEALYTQPIPANVICARKKGK